ncbi:MAG: bifunctional DNA primase/polymerase [Arachnia sp.]
MNPWRLFAAVAPLPLPLAAARFVVAGVPIFPCVPGGKRPLVEHGFHEATSDPRQVRAWWRRWPAANIGMPTGPASGWDVVDVDAKGSDAGFASFDRARRAGLVTGWAALVHSASGGIHAYYPAEPDKPQPCWQAAKAQVDFRGAGGYIIVPPSIIRSGGEVVGHYGLLHSAEPEVRPVDAAALRQFLDPRPAPSFRRTGTESRAQDAERLAGWVAALGKGERNRGLFWAACRLAEAGASPASALDALGPAAEHAGLPPREVFVTIRSAYRAVGTVPARPQSAAPEQAEPPRRAAGVGSQVLS